MFKNKQNSGARKAKVGNSFYNQPNSPPVIAFAADLH